MDVHELEILLLIGSAVLIAAVFAVRVSVTAGLPSLLVYRPVTPAFSLPSAISALLPVVCHDGVEHP